MNTITIKKGYVGNELVVATEYNGMDANLSHYNYKGKKYNGNIAFTKPFSIETVQY